MKTASGKAMKIAATEKVKLMISPEVIVDNNLLTPRKSSTASNKINSCKALFEEDTDRKIDVVITSDSSAATATVTNIIPDSPSLLTTGKKRKAYVVTPSTTTATTTTTADDDSIDNANQRAPSAKRKLLFGRYVELVQTAPNVNSVYKIVRKLTGNIGGNGYSGPIYGELTKHSMQKMIDLMVKNTDFSSSSRFIDVGSGIGKPNLHVAQYPGVEFSCGVEMEHNRWSLGMSCLKACLNAATQEREQSTMINEISLLQGNTMFLHNNILEAKTFDPFTHVYMFSIGFPPELWIQLSNMWNASDAGDCQHLICYAGPKDVIESYEFDVELLTQMPTSMHGSKESHMGYIYRRMTKKKGSKRGGKAPKTSVPCDPLFRPSYNLVQKGLKQLESEVDRQVEEEMGGSRRTRGSRQKTIFSKSANGI
uniref:DOT1 domain-containing protein n=1 Tax=Pseudo-nitzschia australis TaxID=44445 RepID=A0A7S4AKE0_9STRA|mmetsp:Transcript_24441/g.51627  ORF Transcript_24441/g.51627 Transcript_24441/m.51627 type:complete len:424 (+) Transcript_24441:57-1328(+)